MDNDWLDENVILVYVSKSAGCLKFFCNQNRLTFEPISDQCFAPLRPLVIHAANNKLFHTQSTKDGSRDSEVRKIKMQYTPFCTSVVNLRTFFSL